MIFEKINRVYFIGSGPSIAMGLPSVTTLFDEIMKNYEIPVSTFKSRAFSQSNNFWENMRVIVKDAFSNVPRNKINFEELLTLLDESGIAPEIYKIGRLGEDATFRSIDSLEALYKDLVLYAIIVLTEKMAGPTAWSENTFKIEELRVRKENAQTLSKDEIEWEEKLDLAKNHDKKIKSAWFEQYSKINPYVGKSSMWGNVSQIDDYKYRNSVITTNYDLLLETALDGHFSYISPQERKTYILKLHGSMNWFELQPNEFIMDEEILLFKERSRIAARLTKFNNNDGTFSYAREAVIAPPITLKKYDAPLFRQMFWQASKVLMDADELVILGYGFSPYDFFVEKLFDFAINSTKSKIKKIYHFDNDEKLKYFFVGNKKMGIAPFIRDVNPFERYFFNRVDFSTEVPNFDNISGAPIPII